jgi:hypothetical protein
MDLPALDNVLREGVWRMRNLARRGSNPGAAILGGPADGRQKKGSERERIVIGAPRFQHSVHLNPCVLCPLFGQSPVAKDMGCDADRPCPPAVVEA